MGRSPALGFGAGAALLLVAALAAPGPLDGQMRPVPPSRVAEGRLSFDAKATLGDFTGVTSTVEGSITGGADPSAVRGCVQAPVATLVSGNDHRDRDLRKSMETEKHPTMRFELRAVGAPSGGADSMTADLIGDLTLHGVTRADTLPGVLTWRGDSLRVRADFPVDVKDYRVGGLSRFLGVFKMNQHIVVHVDLVFLPDPAAAGACPAGPGSDG